MRSFLCILFPVCCPWSPHIVGRRDQSGLSNIRIGLRYRHEITREIAPYVGVYYSEALGNTADALNADGESTSEAGVVLGARIWF